MAKFRFRLDPLLKARRRSEQTAQLAVAELERERIIIQDTLRHYQHEISGGKDTLRDSLTGAVDMKSLRLQAGAALHLVRKARQAVLQLAGLSKRLETARGRLIEAAKQRRAVELLRDRRYQQWKAVLEKAEIDALDELAVMGAWRTDDSLGSPSVPPKEEHRA